MSKIIRHFEYVENANFIVVEADNLVFVGHCYRKKNKFRKKQC